MQPNPPPRQVVNKGNTLVVRPSWRATLVASWTRRGPLARLLWPVSQLYRGVVALRRQLYRWGILKSQGVDAQVLVVGNVVAGGAGKTPTTIAIVQHFTQQNRQVGVISRGYGRHSTACLEVHANDSPQQVGDEPLLIQRSTQVPVFVGNTRMEAAQALLARYPNTEIIVCDDGLQHYALHRDVEVCVFDDRGCGNQWLLPAGPLREPWPRHAVRQAGQQDDRLLVLHTAPHACFPGYSAHRSLAPHARRFDGSTISLATLAHSPLPLVAVAGIAQPESFFAKLRAMHLPLQRTIGLPDHYDFDSFSRPVYEGYQLICTEKDAQKLWQIDPNAWAIPLVLTIEPAFFAALDHHINTRLAA